MTRMGVARPAPIAPEVATGSSLAMFPGQGSQRAGMAAHLLEQYADIAAPIFAAADDAAGFGLTELCVSGAKQDLTRTEVTQLAVVATSLVTWEILRSTGFRPAAVAGHSLGEFTALVAAGVLTEASAFALVGRRSALMARVAEQTSGGMLAVVGVDPATVERMCGERAGVGVAEVANYNDPHQTVISGHREALVELADAMTAAGADKVVMLEVGAPFHSSLMADIEEEFAEALVAHPFGEPRIPVISSVTGGYLTAGEHARTLLRRQLARPVRWTDTLDTARRTGLTRFTEVGPGRVLTGFVKNTLEDCQALSTGDARRIEAAIREISKERKSIMTETTVETLEAVQASVAEAVGIEVGEAEPDSTVLGDLGAESIDLLDILFRIERKIGVKIQASEIAELLQGELADAEFEDADGVITEAGLAQIAKVLPQIDQAELAGKLTADEVMTLFTVRNLAEMATARAARVAEAS